MRRSSVIWLTLVVIAVMTGCRQADAPVGPEGGSRVVVLSDPAGGHIWLDDNDTGLTTPDTVRGLTGRHNIRVTLDSAATDYAYIASVSITPADTLKVINGPLVSRCGDRTNLPTCYRTIYTYHTEANMTFATNSLGATFLYDAGGDGLFYPKGTRNSYTSGGMPVFAATVGGDTLSLGVYDEPYLAGRPAPEESQPEGGLGWRETSWVIPPFDLLQFATIRGLRIDQQLVSVPSLEGVAVLRIVFRNITADPLYSLVDPIIPTSGLVFNDVFIGYALDPDIGLATDDMLSYEPDLGMVFAYDSKFDEAGFDGGWNVQPALVGLRILETPPGTRIVLNGYANQQGVSLDWHAGDLSEPTGWGMLSGTIVYSPVSSDPRIGHLPPLPGDARIMVSAGPLTLAPGDSAAITLAVVVAPPVPTTFTSGQAVDPGDPLNPARQIHRVAGTLFQQAQAAEALIPTLMTLGRSQH